MPITILPKSFAALAFAILLLSQARPADAVVVRRDDGTQIVGYLREETPTHVIIDELFADGRTVKRSFSKSSVTFRVYVDYDRLAVLRPEQPRKYRDYADELSDKKADPDARRTAIQLYLIAAYLDPEGSGRGCLRSIAKLALTSNEQRAFLAMVYLVDPDHDRSVLEPPRVEAPGPTLDNESVQQLRSGLRSLRTERKRAAGYMVSNSDFSKSLAKFSAILPVAEFEAAAADKSPRLPRSLHRKVVQVEVAVTRPRAKSTYDAATTSAAQSWDDVDWRRPDPSATLLTLETITPIDPRKCIFRDGNWVKP